MLGDVADEALATTRDHQVDLVVAADERGHHVTIARGHRLHRVGRQARGDERLAHDVDQHHVRVERLLATLEDGRVRGLDAQRASVDGHVRARLVDDADDTERDAHAPDLESVGPELEAFDGADRIAQRAHLVDADGHGLDARRGEAKAVDGGRRHAAHLGRLQVARVGLDDALDAAAQLRREQRQRAIAHRARRARERGRGRARRDRQALRDGLGRLGLQVVGDGCGHV